MAEKGHADISLYSYTMVLHIGVLELNVHITVVDFTVKSNTETIYNSPMKLKKMGALMTIAGFDCVRHDVDTNLHILILKLIWK